MSALSRLTQLSRLAQFNSASRPIIDVSHPSLGDHNRSLQIHQEQTERCKRFMKSNRRKIDLLGGDAPPRHQVAIGSFSSRIAMHIKRLADATPSRNIGNVFAMSGHKVSPSRKCLIDWGSISLQHDCVGTNTVRVYI